MRRSPVRVGVILTVVVSGCANSTTTAGGGSSSPTTPPWISGALHRFATLASDSGENHPSKLRYVRTTEGTAEASFFKVYQQSGDRTSQEVVVVEAEGRFTPLMKGPPQPPGQFSRVMIAVFERSTGNLVDWAAAAAPIALNSVGRVVQP